MGKKVEVGCSAAGYANSARGTQLGEKGIIMSEISEVVVDPAQAAVLARGDLNFLGALAEPESFFLRFPGYYLSLFGILVAFKKSFERYAIGLPRGFGKTSFVKLLILWVILFSEKKFILIVGASADLAVNTLSDVIDLLDSPNIRKIFGGWDANRVYVSRQDLKVFSFRGRVIILRAIGAQTTVRGINRKNSRPDFVVMDDIQTKEDAKNPDLAASLLSWMTGTLMKAKSNFDCTFVFIGNMYPQNAILEKLKNASTWTSLIVGGILSDGSSLWEELRPIESLLEEYQADIELGQGDVFCSEVLNSTELPPPSGLSIDSIPYPAQWQLDTEPEGGFILIDPSSGKKKGDDCTIEHYSVIDGLPLFDEIEYGTFSPLETIKAAINMGLEKNTRLVCVEDVAYQSTLLFWFNYICEQEGISGFEFHPVSPKNVAKNNRIKKGLIKAIKGEILIHPKIRALVVDQANRWNPGTVNNVDDIIDPLGYVEEVQQRYSHFIAKSVFLLEDFGATACHDPESSF